MIHFSICTGNIEEEKYENSKGSLKNKDIFISKNEGENSPRFQKDSVLFHVSQNCGFFRINKILLLFHGVDLVQSPRLLCSVVYSTSPLFKILLGFRYIN